MPQTPERHLGGDGDGGRVQQLLGVGSGEGRTDDDAPLGVDDQLTGSGDALTLYVRAGDRSGVVDDRPHRQSAFAGGRVGQAYRTDLRVGEGHPGYHVAARPVADVGAADHVGGDARLVFPHVCQRCQTRAVAYRVEPAAQRVQPVVHGYRPAGRQADRVEAEVVGRRAAADRDEYLVGLDLTAVGERGDDRAVAL